MAEVKKTAKKVPVKKVAKVEKTKAKVAVKAVAPKKAAAKKPAAKKEAVAKVAEVVEAPKVETAPVAPVVEAAKVEAVKTEATKTEVKVETKAEVKSALTQPQEFDLQEMLEAGCHLGHKASKWHPKMAEYIYSEKDGIHLFDLPKVSELLKEACAYVYNLARDGKTIVLVGTKKQAREVIKEAALDASCFYINARWMGGMLTNWPQVSKSIKRMEEIREGLNNGRYNGYTKYERVQLDKEQIKLERFFGGLRGLKSKPDCLFIVDPKKEHIVVDEANGVDVTVIALIDSDSDPRPIKLVIPGNDDAVKSIKFFVDQIAAAYKAGRAARK
jgi:small subunit ribosomal protein S2